MEHGKKNRKFGRETKPRKALLRGLAVALIEKSRITTTAAKAKSLKTYVEKLVTKARTNNLAVTRQLISELHHPSAANKLIKEIGPRQSGHPGGYLRIRKLTPRISDGAARALIEFVA